MRSSLAKDGVAVLDDKLDCVVLRVHVCHLLLNAVISHESGRKHDRQVLWGHLEEKELERTRFRVR